MIRTITFDDSIYKLVPVKANGAWIDNLIKKNGEPSVEMTIQTMFDLVNELLDAAPEYQEPEQICDDGGKCGAGGYCNNCAAPVVKENGKLRERLANQHAKIEQLRASLQECLDRAIRFLNDEIGVKPNELFDYNGWDERARNLLSQDIGKDE